MARSTASDRMRRVLAIVPWIVANPGRHTSEVAARFGLTEAELLNDLSVVFMVGLPPYSPDALVDVQIDDDGRVSINLADFFSRPLRLTAAQGLALVAASDALLSVPGMDSDGALARAIGKLADALGVDDVNPVDIHLGNAEAEHLELLRSAVADGQEVEIDYYSFGRDVRTRRRIAPWRVFADSGSWYVHAWCTLADGERIFRLDRIESLNVVESQDPTLPGAGDRAPAIFNPQEQTPLITLVLDVDAAWVAETYPCERVVQLDDGGTQVTLAVTAMPWLERLLVRLGPHGRVVGAESFDGADDLASTAASRILARYAMS